MTRDSIAISDIEGAVSIPRDAIERVDLDQRARSSWLRFWECGFFALHGGSAVSEFRSENTIRAAIFGAMAGVEGWMCLRPHSWARARLPDVGPPSGGPDSAAPGL